jgi:hypothetical protein
MLIVSTRFLALAFAPVAILGIGLLSRRFARYFTLHSTV